MLLSFLLPMYVSCSRNRLPSLFVLFLSLMLCLCFCSSDVPPPFIRVLVLCLLIMLLLLLLSVLSELKYDLLRLSVQGFSLFCCTGLAAFPSNSPPRPALQTRMVAGPSLLTPLLVLGFLCVKVVCCLYPSIHWKYNVAWET